jgi:hypothetical protein
MAKRKVQVNLVSVPAAIFRPRKCTAPLKLGHYPLRRALGDANSNGHVPKSHFRVLSDAKENVRVVCEKGPGAFRRATLIVKRCLIHVSSSIQPNEQSESSGIACKVARLYQSATMFHRSSQPLTKLG